MKKKFFNAIFYLLILISISACNQVSDLLNTVDYVGTVKKIEINSPDYNSKELITIEELVHGFLKANYDEVTKEDIKWEKLGNLDNGQMIKASFRDAYVKIEAIKNGDFIQVKPIEIDFRGKNGDRYNFIDLPFKKPSKESTTLNNISTNTNYNSSSSNKNYSNESSTEEFIPNISGSTAYQTETDDKIYDQIRNKFGKVANDKYVGGSLINFIKNSNDPLEYEYLRAQFHEILDTMYVTEDKITYYYLNDIIAQLASKADTDSFAREYLNVKGDKLYYVVGWPKEYAANMPSWIEFEIFERKFKDGLALRTAHISCAINGVEYKDWEAVAAIYK